MQDPNASCLLVDSPSSVCSSHILHVIDSSKIVVFPRQGLVSVETSCAPSRTGSKAALNRQLITARICSYRAAAQYPCELPGMRAPAR